MRQGVIMVFKAFRPSFLADAPTLVQITLTKETCGHLALSPVSSSIFDVTFLIEVRNVTF